MKMKMKMSSKKMKRTTKRKRDAATLTILPEMSKKMKQAKAEEEEAGYAITLLPESMIHHIQSFLTGKDAARTSLLSKSWYDAWLTRPTLSFDEYDFKKGGFGAFEKISTETMERYPDMNLRIESFSLRTGHESLAKKLITDAIKIGATDLNIEMLSIGFFLPPEVLGSETLTRLRLSECRIAEGNVMIRCSRLKSLVLKGVCLAGDGNILRDIISSCTCSIEELSLSDHQFIKLNLFVLHKFRRLYLSCVKVGDSFFSDMASRFPCLKDLSICNSTVYTRIQIASTSLESIRFEEVKKAFEAEFDVPNIRKFVYSGKGSPPSVCFKVCSSEWKSDISLSWDRNHKPSGFLSLKRLLSMFRGSRISLSITSFLYSTSLMKMRISKRISKRLSRNAVVVENLKINEGSYSSILVLGLFSACIPTTTFIAEHKIRSNLFQICEAVKQDLTTLKLTSQYNQMVEFYDKDATEWKPIIKPPTADDSTPNIRVHLAHCTPRSSH